VTAEAAPGTETETGIEIIAAVVTADESTIEVGMYHLGGPRSILLVYHGTRPHHSCGKAQTEVPPIANKPTPTANKPWCNRVPTTAIRVRSVLAVAHFQDRPGRSTWETVVSHRRLT